VRRAACFGMDVDRIQEPEPTEPDHAKSSTQAWMNQRKSSLVPAKGRDAPEPRRGSISFRQPRSALRRIMRPVCLAQRLIEAALGRHRADRSRARRVARGRHRLLADVDNVGCPSPNRTPSKLVAVGVRARAESSSAVIEIQGAAPASLPKWGRAGAGFCGRPIAIGSNCRPAGLGPRASRRAASSHFCSRDPRAAPIGWHVARRRLGRPLPLHGTVPGEAIFFRGMPIMGA